MAPPKQLHPVDLVSYASVPAAATVANSYFRVGTATYYSDGTNIKVVSTIPSGSTAYRGVRVASGATATDVCPKFQTLTDGATITPDLALGYTMEVTLAGNRTIAAPTNAEAGDTMIMFIIQDGTGGRSLTWNAVFKWPSGTAPTLTATAGAVDVIGFARRGTDWYGSAALAFV